MKRIFILSFLLCGGCAYTPHQFPLQPGESIAFKSVERANDYRQHSGNDFYGTNRVVQITRPCAVTCE